MRGFTRTGERPYADYIEVFESMMLITASVLELNARGRKRWECQAIHIGGTSTRLMVKTSKILVVITQSSWRTLHAVVRLARVLVKPETDIISARR